MNILIDIGHDLHLDAFFLQLESKKSSNEQENIWVFGVERRRACSSDPAASSSKPWWAATARPGAGSRRLAGCWKLGALGFSSIFHPFSSIFIYFQWIFVIFSSFFKALGSSSPKKCSRKAMKSMAKAWSTERGERAMTLDAPLRNEDDTPFRRPVSHRFHIDFTMVYHGLEGFRHGFAMVFVGFRRRFEGSKSVVGRGAPPRPRARSPSRGAR